VGAPPFGFPFDFAQGFGQNRTGSCPVLARVGPGVAPSPVDFVTSQAIQMQVPRLRSGFRYAAQRPRRRLNLNSARSSHVSQLHRDMGHPARNDNGWGVLNLLGQSRHPNFAKGAKLEWGTRHPRAAALTGFGPPSPFSSQLSQFQMPPRSRL
jgi:hypothetical protein